MLNNLKRSISNWSKERKRTEQGMLHLPRKDKISELIESLDSVVLQDPKHKVFVDPHDLEGVFREGVCRIKEREQPITPEFIQEILKMLLLVNITHGPEDYLFDLYLERYTGKKDERYCIDAFARLRNKPGWSKVWALEYTLPLT